jgi:hypothetical protein
MIRWSRLMLVCSALTLAGCAADSTAPTPQRTLTPPGVNLDEEILPDGTCRSGFTLTNGRCVPI